MTTVRDAVVSDNTVTDNIEIKPTEHSPNDATVLDNAVSKNILKDLPSVWHQDSNIIMKNYMGALSSELW